MCELLFSLHILPSSLRFINSSLTMQNTFMDAYHVHLKILLMGRLKAGFAFSIMFGLELRF